MKSELVIYLLGILLLTGCAGATKVAPHLARHSDEILKQARMADDAYKAAQKAHQSRELGTVVKEADRALQATQQAKEAHRQAIQSAPHAQQSDEITRILQQVDHAELNAQFIKLQAQAEDAVAATTKKIKSSQGELASASDSELNEFLGDLLCFHLESLVEKLQLPSEKDYQEFLQDYAIARVVRVWEIKEKAESIIKFTESTAERPSPALVHARIRLLQECTIKRSGK